MKITRTADGLLLAAALSLCLAAPASAQYADLTERHWAYSQMSRAHALGIINGVGGNRMDPDGALTWAQFLAMMSRTFAPELYRSASQELTWDQAGYQVALDARFLLPDDAPEAGEDTLDEPITRQDTAVLISRALPENAKGDASAPDPAQASASLSDYDALDDGVRAAVDRLYALGVLKGKSDGSFGPDDVLHRADGAVLLVRALECVDRVRLGETRKLNLHFVDPGGAEVYLAYEVEARIGYSISWIVNDFLPENYVFLEFAGNSTVSSACSDYTVVVRAMTALEINEQESIQKYYSGELNYDAFIMQDFWLRKPDENPRKHLLLFGSADKRRFSSRAEAEQHMATVTVPVWQLKNGAKVAATASVQVHAALADDVTAIFTEIFNDPEQFPIMNLTGYGWRGGSAKGEHNCGTAIDINPEQNYQVRNGRAEAGSLWAPGTDPLSIPADGSVVRIFEEHGWSWGGDTWAWDADPATGYHDYMHFSYMGG